MLSVIVPIYNAAHVLRDTVPAILSQEEDDAEWIFVDDGSTDDSRTVLGELIEVQVGLKTQVLSHPTNRGRASARNTGIEKARGDVVVFLDADVAPGSNFLSALNSAFQASDGTVAAIGRLQIASSSSSDPYMRYLASSQRGPSQHYSNDATPWKYFLTTAAAVQKYALEEVGGFDDSVSYGEDLDLAVRLSRLYPQGLRYAPDAFVKQFDLGTLETALMKMIEFGQDNLPHMVARHPELAQWTGVDAVDSASSLDMRRLGASVLLRPTISKAIRQLLPYLPGRLSNVAVRYLLGYTLATSYKEGLKAQSTH